MTPPASPVPARVGKSSRRLSGLCRLVIVAGVGIGVIAGASDARADSNVAQVSGVAEPNVHPVRALLEFQSVFLLGMVYYLTTAGFEERFDLEYRWDVFGRKLSGESFMFDTNHFGTNFIGHPLGGAGYYLSSRSNGIGNIGSSAIAITGSLLWELFGEVREEVSMNDMIVTPMAGISIGETTYQMARFFDRAEPTLVNRALGLLLGPFTTLNDAIDGTAPRRAAKGYPDDGWNQVMTHAGLSHVSERSSRRGHLEAAVTADLRVENLPAPASQKPLQTGWFDDGNVTRLRLELAASSSGLSRVELTTHAVLFGIQYAAARHAHDAEFGFLGLGMGFDYTARSFERAVSAPLNRLSAVHPLGLSTGHHVRRGAFTLDSWLRAGAAFGGLDVLELTPEQRLDLRFPSVTRLHGYYMGWGASSEAQVQMGFRDVRWGASMSAEGYSTGRAPGEPVPARMRDTFRQTHGYFGYHFPNTSSELRAFWTWRGRAGTAERAGSVEREHHYRSEHSLGLQLCAFGN